MALYKINQIFSTAKLKSVSSIRVTQRTFFFGKKKKKAPEPKVVCPPTHEEIPIPSTFYQNLAGFSLGAILGSLIDTYGRPFYREKFPPPPPCPEEVKEDECPEE